MGRPGNTNTNYGNSSNPQIGIDQEKYDNKVSENYSSLNETSYDEKSNIYSNAKKASNIFPMTEKGFFGVQGDNCRVIKCSNAYSDSQLFFNILKSGGGPEKEFTNGHGVYVDLADGTRVSYRKYTSTKGSPAVEITVSGSDKVKNQKIHFEEE